MHYNTLGAGSLPHKETIRSISGSTIIAVPAGEANITVYSPHFYVAWAANKSMQQTLTSEMLSKTEEKRSVEVSNIELIISLLDGSEGAVEKNSGYPGRWLIWCFIGGMKEWIFLRQRMATKIDKRLVSRSRFPSVIDRRILHLPDVDPRVYGNCVMQALLVETVGFGSGPVLRIYDLIIRGALIYLAWQGFVEADTLKPWRAIGGLVAWRMLKGVL